MVKEVSSLWAELPALARRGFIAGGFVVAILSGGAASSVVLSQDTSRLDLLEENDAKQDATLSAIAAEQDRTSRGVQFMVCRDKRREEGKALDYCDMFWEAKDFLPPAPAGAP